MTVALMWEARAADGRGCELLEWARQQAQAEVSRAAADGTRGPLRREFLRAPQDRVLVLTWWDAPYDADLPELPEPEADLITRAVHRWRFESVWVE
ncbi:hypothetical protein OG372_22155 [Streptomyces sp. NBC_01020]|uniref:hypothetical protein n=1 Tax=unclassified Streptomyces TaxID=2593676 RepID=UPI002E1EDA93|nr:hypothetical protein OG372_22155 [Streptomyces sp. NBC_01020]WSX67828.1 hypothetical protein OG221_14985 [Streptomyces sp. NBC_00932]